MASRFPVGAKLGNWSHELMDNNMRQSAAGQNLAIRLAISEAGGDDHKITQDAFNSLCGVCGCSVPYIRVRVAVVLLGRRSFKRGALGVRRPGAEWEFTVGLWRHLAEDAARVRLLGRHGRMAQKTPRSSRQWWTTKQKKLSKPQTRALLRSCRRRTSKNCPWAYTWQDSLWI